MARETLIQMRQGSASAWTSANPTLSVGELGVITDNLTVKVGDGATSWSSMSGYLPNTGTSNTFFAGQTITPKATNVIGLNITGGMRYAFITSAVVSQNGSQITYTYATNGGGLSGGLIAVGDYVTISGFSNSNYNYSNVAVVAVTLGGSPTFTINGSATPSQTVTGTGSTWFYETTTGMANLQRWSYTGPGGAAGTSQTNIAATLTANGSLTLSNNLQVGNNLIINGGVASDISFNTSIDYGIRFNTATYYSTARIQATASTTTTGYPLIETKAAGTGNYYHQVFADPSGIIGYIKTLNGATSLVSSSDYRLKENIVPIEDAVEKVKLLKPSRFNFKHVSDTTLDGFIAHEVAEVVPMAVDGEKDAVDENGDPIYQGIDASKLIPILTAALQDALARIEVLEKKVK